MKATGNYSNSAVVVPSSTSITSENGTIQPQSLNTDLEPFQVSYKIADLNNKLVLLIYYKISDKHFLDKKKMFIIRIFL